MNKKSLHEVFGGALAVSAVVAGALVPSFASSQENAPLPSILEGYRGYFENMPHSGSVNQMMGGFAENSEWDAVNKRPHHYTILVTIDANGKALSQPLRVAVPDEAVVDIKKVRELCRDLKANDSATCTAPPFNVISSSGIVTDAKGQSKIGQIYSYSPKPVVCTKDWNPDCKPRQEFK